MKKLLYLAAALALLATASCKDDEGGPPPVTDAIMFDGKGYNGEKGLVFDYGDDGEYYNYDFMVADANITMEDLEADQIDATFLMYAELFSLGTESFRTGTFTSGAGENLYYTNIQLIVDTNNDGMLSSEDQLYDVQNGDFTVAGGTGTNYTLTFDLTVAGGKKLTGTYSGNFEYIDPFGERAPGEDLRKVSRFPFH